MRYIALFAIALLIITGCTSSERKEIRRRTPNFVAVESDAPQTAAKKRRPNQAKKIRRPTTNQPVFERGEWPTYPVTQGTMLILDGGKQQFLPFKEGILESSLVQQIMEIDPRHFELLGGFEGYLNADKIIITSKDIYDQKPIYKWITAEKTRYAVEIPEVARNRFQNGSFKYIALEVVSKKHPDKKFYFHVDPRNIARPIVVYRSDAKVQRVVMGNSDDLISMISENLWVNEPIKNEGPKIAIPDDTTTRSIQILHLVRLYFSPQGQEFFDPKYESAQNKNEVTSKQDLVLVGRFTGEGLITGKFEKGARSNVFDVDQVAQYHFKQNALTQGRGGIKDNPTRMEIEFFTLKLGQDEDQLRLALQQAQFKQQQKLNVFFLNNGKRLSKNPDFSFSLKRVDDAAKLAMIKRQPLKPKQSDGGYTTPHHLSSAVLELDLKSSSTIIQ
ncbi:MAG: hypothetical protein HQM14_10935 [SAR324 cluster bacterium]|nr:hypothetical protein [SAR324 cluster bacterium]